MVKEKKKTKFKDPTRNSAAFNVVSVVIVALYCSTLILVTGWAIMTSLKSIIDFTLNPLGFPKEIRFTNYVNAFKEIKQEIPWGGGRRTVFMPELFLNSIIYIAGTTFFSLVSHIACAYVAAKYPCKVTRIMHTIVIIKMAVPVVGSLGTQMIMLKATGVYDNRLMYFIYCAGFTGTNFLIFYFAFKGVSWDYAEAAIMDGAGPYRIFFQIMIPMIKSIIIAITITSCIGAWNDWNTPLIWMPSSPTIAFALYKFQFSTQNSVSTTPTQVAGCILVMLPTLIAFILLRKKFIGQITFGGLKG